MASYTISISSELDLTEQWDDSPVEHMNFGYNETSLDECVDNGDGTYTATYETLELAAPQSYTYIHPLNGKTTYTLAAGEYGVKPNSQRMA